MCPKSDRPKLPSIHDIDTAPPDDPAAAAAPAPALGAWGGEAADADEDADAGAGSAAAAAAAAAEVYAAVESGDIAVVTMGCLPTTVAAAATS